MKKQIIENLEDMFVGQLCEKDMQAVYDAVKYLKSQDKVDALIENKECEHPFASVMSKCNGEINHCLKCGEKF